jgi:hypothetical protein
MTLLGSPRAKNALDEHLLSIGRKTALERLDEG